MGNKENTINNDLHEYKHSITLPVNVDTKEESKNQNFSLNENIKPKENKEGKEVESYFY